MKVIVDESEGEVSVGRSEYDSPEIDNIIHIKNTAEVGTFNDVEILEANEYELIGKIIK